MKPLTITERALLRRRHGLEVLSERSDGTARVMLQGGDIRTFATAHLRELAQPSIGQRLREWVAGCAS